MTSTHLLCQPIFALEKVEHHICQGHTFKEKRYNNLPRIHRIERKLRDKWKAKVNIKDFWTSIISDRPGGGRKRHQLMCHYLHVDDHPDCDHYKIEWAYEYLHTSVS